MTLRPLYALLVDVRGDRTMVQMAAAIDELLTNRDRPLSRQHVYNWETGKSQPSRDVLNAYAILAPGSAEDLLRAAGLSDAVDAITTPTEAA